ncbi:hypothetical protein HMPREF9450_01968 [Alistipes indistinctus YIT 12060]|uniref:Uncharacterized protein n=1 Tax=Alistipes indistinctus YIT 12060 TaxID=742725 RepID=G5HBF3_9BACT|nr:hypothetical protein HMPREF9450_01968 [Alistipes indistinctus YIT 12060]
MKMKTKKLKGPCKQLLDDRQIDTLSRLIIEEAGNHNLERGAEHKKRILPPCAAVMIF